MVDKQALSEANTLLREGKPEPTLRSGADRLGSCSGHSTSEGIGAGLQQQGIRVQAVSGFPKGSLLLLTSALKLIFNLRGFCLKLQD